MIRIISSELVENEISIFGTNISSDTRSAGYNIGDLLNIPHLAGFWQATPHNSPEDLSRLYTIGEYYKRSMLSYYIEARPYDEVVPSIYRIKGALERCICNRTKEEEDELLPFIDVVQDQNTLCVHIRCGDKIVEAEFIALIQDFAKKITRVFIFSGLHLDEYFVSNEAKKRNFLQTMNHLLTADNIHLVLCDPDIHLILMMKASNLLLHKGGFSAIGLIVGRGNIFVTKLLDVLNETWKTNVDTKYTFIEI